MKPDRVVSPSPPRGTVGLLAEAQRLWLIANGVARAGGQEVDPYPVVRLYTLDAGCVWLLSELGSDGDLAYGLCDVGIGLPALGSVRLSVSRRCAGPRACGWWPIRTSWRVSPCRSMRPRPWWTGRSTAEAGWACAGRYAGFLSVLPSSQGCPGRTGADTVGPPSAAGAAVLSRSSCRVDRSRTVRPNHLVRLAIPGGLLLHAGPGRSGAGVGIPAAQPGLPGRLVGAVAAAFRCDRRPLGVAISWRTRSSTRAVRIRCGTSALRICCTCALLARGGWMGVKVREVLVRVPVLPLLHCLRLHLHPRPLRPGSVASACGGCGGASRSCIRAAR